MDHFVKQLLTRVSRVYEKIHKFANAQFWWTSISTLIARSEVHEIELNSTVEHAFLYFTVFVDKRWEKILSVYVKYFA